MPVEYSGKFIGSSSNSALFIYMWYWLWLGLISLLFYIYLLLAKIKEKKRMKVLEIMVSKVSKFKMLLGSLLVSNKWFKFGRDISNTYCLIWIIICCIFLLLNRLIDHILRCFMYVQWRTISVCYRYIIFQLYVLLVFIY